MSICAQIAIIKNTSPNQINAIIESWVAFQNYLNNKPIGETK